MEQGGVCPGSRTLRRRARGAWWPGGLSPGASQSTCAVSSAGSTALNGVGPALQQLWQARPGAGAGTAGLGSDGARGLFVLGAILPG